MKSQIIHGDILEILPALQPEEKFDVIIADPPYNIGKDFGDNHDRMPLSGYVEWTSRWAHKCLDLLSDNGIMYIYGLPEIAARISVLFPPDEQRWLVWHYTNKTAPRSKFWQRSHETILSLWKPGRRRPKLEINAIREPYTDAFLNSAGTPRKSTDSRYGNSKTTRYTAHHAGALPRDVLKVAALAGGPGAAERWFMCRTCQNNVYHPSRLRFHREHDIMKHPTQKPAELTRRLIRSRIPGKEGRVLVPFAGSGSECVVAQSLGVGFVGVEINHWYVRLANGWLSQPAQGNEPANGQQSLTLF